MFRACTQRIAHARSLAVAILTLATVAASPVAAATTRGSFDRPPFYHGKLPAMTSPVAHVAVAYREDPASLDPTPSNSPALAGLLDSLRAELDRLGLTRALAGGDWPMRDAPSLRFGAQRGGMQPDGTPRSPDEIDTSEPRRMTFEVEGPGRAWRDRVAKAAGDSIGAVLFIQLGFSDQWVRQTSWKGSKSIEIGTNRAMPVQWLTSLDDPVQVLQLTGAILTPAGKILRVGAEGLLARRTGMVASVAGAQEVLTEQELAALEAPEAGGTPVWRAALEDLVKGLLSPSGR